VSDAGRLAGFGLVLVVALGIGLGVGSAVGPLDTGGRPTVVEHSGTDLPAGHGAMETETGQ